MQHTMLARQVDPSIREILGLNVAADHGQHTMMTRARCGGRWLQRIRTCDARCTNAPKGGLGTAPVQAVLTGTTPGSTQVPQSRRQCRIARAQLGQPRRWIGATADATANADATTVRHAHCEPTRGASAAHSVTRRTTERTRGSCTQSTDWSRALRVLHRVTTRGTSSTSTPAAGHCSQYAEWTGSTGRSGSSGSSGC